MLIGVSQLVYNFAERRFRTDFRSTVHRKSADPKNWVVGVEGEGQKIRAGWV